MPAYVMQSPVIGWNAGANSVAVRSGDMHVFNFTVRLSGAVVVGFKERRTNQLTPELIEHGLLFQLVGGLRYVRVVEFGVTKTEFVLFDESEVFEIRRRNSVVSYFKNHRLFYSSDRLSNGTRLVNACLYVSGDTVT